MNSQGLDLKIKGTRVVTFSTLRGCFEACSTPTSKGYQMYFYRDEGVEGVAFMTWFKTFPTHSLILTISMLLKRLISTIKSRNVCNVGVGGRVYTKKTKSVGRASKNCLRLAWCLISKSPAPGGEL